MDTKQVTVKLGSDSKQTKPTNTKKNNKTQPTVDLSKEFAKAKEENKTTLNLSKNNITVVPSSIKDLTNLVELYLYGNKINMLPPEIGNLTQLQTLALNENQVSICGDLKWGRMKQLKCQPISINFSADIAARIATKFNKTKSSRFAP